MEPTTLYLCNNCEERFEIIAKSKESISCPFCKGQALPVQENLQKSHVQNSNNLQGKMVHRCDCGETKKELHPGNKLSCVSCNIILETQAMIVYNIKKENP